MITSNVPGPPNEIYCAGAHVLGIHAMAPLFEGANLNITAVSYGGTFNWASSPAPTTSTTSHQSRAASKL